MGNLTTLFLEFLKISAVASLMVLITMAIRTFVSKRINPNLIMVIWIVILIRLCLPFTFSSQIHIFDIMPKHPVMNEGENKLTGILGLLSENLLEPVTETTEVVAEAGTLSTDNTTNNSDDEKIPTAISIKTGELISEGPVSQSFNRVSLWDVLAIVWLLGIIFVLLTSIKNRILFKQKLSVCKPIISEDIIKMMEHNKKKIGTEKEISLLECNHIRIPMVFGYIKPRILFPTKFIDKSNGNLLDSHLVDSILLHEICHIKRHDLLYNYIWLFAKALHWFNPFIWVGYRMFMDDAELCCDQVIACCLSREDRLVYSEALIKAARFLTNNQHRIPTVITAFCKTKSKLKERVTRLVNPLKNSKVLTLMVIVLAVFMSLMCFTTACYPIQNGTDVVKDAGYGNVGNQKATTVKCRDSFYAGDKSVKFNINADVISPDIDIPTVDVRPQVISMEKIKDIAEIFFRNNPVYEPQLIMTKTQLKGKIREYEKIINNKKDLLKNYDGNQEAVDRLIENYKDRVIQYEKMSESAPDTNILKETDWEFHPELYYMDEVEADFELIR